jgi:hypothetical protein
VTASPRRPHVTATAVPGIRARQWECLAHGSLRVIQQLSQLVEQLKFQLPAGTQPDVQLPRTRCPLALAPHV